MIDPDAREVAMLAEIFLLRLEFLMRRADAEKAAGRDRRFVPIVKPRV